MQGAADTKEYRQFVQHEGKDVSAWHDIPLQNEDGSFNFVCEIPKETSAKMEVATVRSRTCRVIYKYVSPHVNEAMSESNMPTSSSALAAAICGTDWDQLGNADTMYVDQPGLSCFCRKRSLTR